MGTTANLYGLTINDADRSAAIGSTRNERLRHVAWAALIALLMAGTLFLEPLDWGLWTNQSRLSDRQPSGRIVYLQLDSKISAADYPAERLKLAKALDRLHGAGASRVFIDTVLEKSTSPRADDALLAAIGRWGTSITFVDRIDVSQSGEREEKRTDAIFASDDRRVVQGTSDEWPNFVWSMPYAYVTSRGERPSFSAALGERSGTATQTFLFDYSLPGRVIPQLDLTTLLAGKQREPRNLAGKTIVIGTERTATSADYIVPSQLAAPPSFVAINAAESLGRKPIMFVSGIVIVLALALFLAGGTMQHAPRRRRLSYAAAGGVIVYLAMVSASAGLRFELSYGVVLLAVFGILRSRSNWKHRVAMVEPDTGLPTMRAMTRQVGQKHDLQGYVVVAKIHGYEALQRSLDVSQRAAYVRKLIERLRVGNPRLPVFFENHYLAWQADQEDEAKLRGHLEGLRAIFAAPVHVGEHSIDVGITFGAALLGGGAFERCLAAAQAAVEDTTEALEPIKVADASAESDTLWDLSLRARIDAAMEAGEVFCVYQPKIDISVNRLIGVEALVRWEDPERGFIPPMHFVMQCEKAGRMEYLTRYVLQSACSAARLLHFRGSRITMSVNISATLLTDMRIVGIVRNVLQATGFDPNYLVLEITETARIRDLTQARSVLKALKALGTHLSMDDFGVGAANFEALQALPFDEIKIDREFVSRAASSTKARAITASIVGLGLSAKIAVVAEGAETESDLQMLRDIGCWQVQGYALARPMPLTKLLDFIKNDAGLSEAATV